jgi:hypothetical protein
MNIYHVDKLECPVTLFLQDGLVREGVVFLSPFSPSHAGAQTLLELVNEEAPFFPFRRDDGSFSLVNKALVSHLRFQAPPPEDWPLGHRIEVSLAFAGGEVLRGTLTVQAPEGKDRLQDFLNLRQTFIQIDCGDAHYLVNPRLTWEIVPH